MTDRTPAGPIRLPARILAWLGGAAFVASLAYFLYFYAIRLGRPAPAGASVWTNLAIDTGLFAAFAIHHSAMARAGAKRWLTRRVPEAYERSIYVWLASLLFFGACWGWRDLPGRIYRVDGLAALPFYLAQATGVLVALASARSIDIFDLSGIRQLSHGAPAHLASSPVPGRLETGGLYRLVRHPVYMGTLLLMVATPDLTTGRLLFTALSLLYLVIGIAFEERSLREEFGVAYDAYRAKVRWRMIPGIY